MLIALFAIILTLLLVVGLHEAGHAIAARFLASKLKLSPSVSASLLPDGGEKIASGYGQCGH